MEYTTLGRGGIRVSRMCFGTLTMSPLQTNMPPRDGARLLCRAYERGVNFLDTADLYGTYPHIKLALKDCPDYVISTKAYCYDEKTAREALERALRGTGRDYIDIFMLHEQESKYTLRGHMEAVEYLEKKRQAGVIRMLGASTHCVPCADAIVKFPLLRVLHPLINYQGKGIRNGTLEEMEQALIRAHDVGIGIFAMKPLGGGHLIPDSAKALEYILTRPFIDAAAIGMQSMEEVDADIDAFEDIEKAREELERLSHRTRKLMIHDWCEGCGACAARCPQGALSVIDGKAHVDERKCVLCGYCADVCPQFCLKVV